MKRNKEDFESKNMNLLQDNLLFTASRVRSNNQTLINKSKNLDFGEGITIPINNSVSRIH